MGSSSDRALLIGSYLGNEDVGRAIARKQIKFRISKRFDPGDHPAGVEEDIFKMEELMSLKGVKTTKICGKISKEDCL